MPACARRVPGEPASQGVGRGCAPAHTPRRRCPRGGRHGRRLPLEWPPRRDHARAVELVPCGPLQRVRSADLMAQRRVGPRGGARDSGRDQLRQRLRRRRARDRRTAGRSRSPGGRQARHRAGGQDRRPARVRGGGRGRAGAGRPRHVVVRPRRPALRARRVGLHRAVRSRTGISGSARSSSSCSSVWWRRPVPPTCSTPRS